MEEVNMIKKLLHEEVYRFDFFKAVHLLELFAGRASGAGLSPDHDPVHFKVKPGISFPASDIQQIKSNGNGSAPQMTVNFMGLIGPNGVLPDWYNAHAHNRNYYKDYSFTDFLDLFHHRLISLFYMAWKKYRLAANYRSDGSDPISGILANLAGISEREKANDPEFFSHAQKRLTFFCGLTARTVPTVSAIKTIVGHAVGAPVHIEQFVERLIPIHKQDRTRLGSKNSTLKKDALCGRNIRDASSFFSIQIGPVSWERYMAFAPRSSNLEMTRRLIAYLAGIEYEFDIKLIIRGDDIPALRLGSKMQPPILGRTVTLRQPQSTFNRDIIVTAKFNTPAYPH